MKPCRNLDHDETRYPDCELKRLTPDYPDVLYWHRNQRFIDHGPRDVPGTQNVQFCILRGRVNSILDCYQPGFMHCYEPEEEVSDD